MLATIPTTFATLPPRWQASADFASLAVAGQGLLDSIELSRRGC